MSADNPLLRDAVEAPEMVYWSSLGQIERVEKLLAEGGNANAVDAGGYSALHAASENNHLDLVKLLLAHGASVNYASAGHTALKLARLANNREIVTFLLANGAE